MGIARENIERLDPYVPGYQPEGNNVIKLNTNENPYPPSDKVLEAIRQAASEKLRLYPDSLWKGLRKTASKIYEIGEDYLFFGNGSDEILSLIFKAFIDKNDYVVSPYPTYSYYKVMANIQDARFEYIDTDNLFNIPFDSLADCGAKMICFANPNTPTGIFEETSTIENFLNSFSGLLILDEAYIDFAKESAYRLAAKYNNLIVTRTFSKSFSLCGIRVGYCFANPELIKILLKVKESYNINALSQIAAKSALEDIFYSKQNTEKIVKTRDRYTEKFRKLGFFVLPSASNFIFIKHEKFFAKDIFDFLFSKNIYVRYFELRRLDKYLRITIGREDEMSCLIDALSTFIV